MNESTRNMDVFSGKLHPRSRGQRGKLHGGILFEEVTIDIVKQLKNQCKQDGDRAPDAWDKAYKILKVATGRSHETIKDWVRGARRREREKPIDERSFRRRKRLK